jgi:hypothetical protein
MEDHVTGGTDDLDERVESDLEDDEASAVTGATPATGHAPAGPGAAPADDTTETRPVEISQSQVTGLRAAQVSIRDSRVDTLTAERADLTKVFAQHVNGRLVQMDESTAVRVEAKRLVAEKSRMVGIVAEQARFVRSRVGFVVARQVELSADSRIVIHVGPLRSGVRPTVSTRTAAGFGAGLGAALAIGIGLLGRRRR